MHGLYLYLLANSLAAANGIVARQIFSYWCTLKWNPDQKTLKRATQQHCCCWLCWFVEKSEGCQWKWFHFLSAWGMRTSETFLASRSMYIFETVRNCIFSNHKSSITRFACAHWSNLARIIVHCNWLLWNVHNERCNAPGGIKYSKQHAWPVYLIPTSPFHLSFFHSPSFRFLLWHHSPKRRWRYMLPLLIRNIRCCGWLR